MKEKLYEYVYVENNGIVRELDSEEIKYLKTEFSPFDSARPYIKTNYEQIAPDNSISGFLLRSKVPNHLKIISTSLRYEQIGFPITINDTPKIIELMAGKYSIHLLGTWNIHLNDFCIHLKDKEKGTLITAKKCIIHNRTYLFGERAIKIMHLNILNKGDYLIKYKNPESLKVSSFNSIFAKIFSNTPNQNKEIQICINPS